MLAAAGDSAFLASALTIMTIRLNLTSLLGFMLKHARLSIHATSKHQRGARLQRVQKFCLHGYTCRWMRTPQPAGEARSSYELRPAQIASTREAPAPELQYRALSASLPAVTLPRKPEQRSAFCVLTCSRRAIIPRVPYLEYG